MSVLWSAYRLLAPAVGAVAPWGELAAGKEERRWWSERLGRLRPLETSVDAWIHSASLGEAVAAAALRDALRARRAEARFLLTATTRTGRQRLAALEPAVSMAPLDTPQAAAGFFAAVRPARLFLIETELWPQWLLRARRARVPVAVVSARLSPRSARRYGWLGAPLRGLVRELVAVLCQTDEDRARWLSLGARPERTAVAGNLKFDALPEPAADRGQARAARRLDPARPLLVLASLRPGEGGLLAAAWNALPAEARERWQVVAVPRHPQASRSIRIEAENAGVMVVDAGPPPSGAWLWDDRPGVLTGYYVGADAAFVGGTLAAHGGHNPLEPAAAGAAVIVGPHHGAQGPAMEVLEKAGAVLVTSETALPDSLHRLLQEEPRRRQMADAGSRAAHAARGAAGRAVEKLVEWGVWPSA